MISLSDTPNANYQGIAAATEPLISLRGISKQFPGVLANDNVEMNIFEGNAQICWGIAEYWMGWFAFWKKMSVCYFT